MTTTLPERLRGCNALKTKVDADELLLIQSDLRQNLFGPLRARNQAPALFSIAAQMYILEVPEWKELVHYRGKTLGVSLQRLARIVESVPEYVRQALNNER